jgi:hypothetical protein
MENKTRRTFQIAAALVVLLATELRAADEIVQIGTASYTTRLPAGAKLPPPVQHRGAGLRGKVPSNDWWSSLLWSSNTFAHFPHPLAVKVEGSGLRVAYPGANLTANQAAIFGSMPGGTNDFILGHSAQAKFPTFTVEEATG